MKSHNNSHASNDYYSSKNLSGLRFLLVNPWIFPYDLRRESHSPEEWKSERSMNFGLLVIASHLSKLSAEVQIVNLEVSGQLESLSKAINEFSPHIVGIGNISAYSYLATIEITKYVKRNAKDLPVVVGGQNPQYILKQMAKEDEPPDYVIIGPGEIAIEKLSSAILEGRNTFNINGVAYYAKGVYHFPNQLSTVLSLDTSAFLLYDLYPEWETYFPLVEESRGCPYRCNFCCNAAQDKHKQIQLKCPDILYAEIKRITKLWGKTGDLPIVLMCANFGVDAKRTNEFLTLVKNDKDLKPQFLAAMRVDAPWSSYLDNMEGIFDQVHFGVESGSAITLGRMNKAKDPDQYLAIAERAFRAFRTKKIHVAVNFILGYIGEDGRSLGDSIAFFLNNREQIDSCWGGALIQYPGTPFATEIPKHSERYGTSREKVSPLCDRIGVYPINPSKYISFSLAADLSLGLMKMMNDRKSFYEHYRWYPGPVKDSCGSISFLPEEKFFELFHASKEYRDIGYSEIFTLDST